MRWLKKRRAGQLAVIVFCLCCLCIHVNAQSMIDVKAACQMKIRYQFADAVFSLYKVADVTQDGKYVVTDEFSSDPVDFTKMDEERGRELAGTLAGYVKRDQRKAFDTGTTDAKGCLTFDDLSVGVYLVMGDSVREEDTVYRSQAFLAFVPLSLEDGSLEYSPEFSPKFSEKMIGKSDRTVMKIWKDDDKAETRPEKIWIQLLKDGHIYEEVALSKENNWMYTWKGLSSEYSWQAVEKEVPDGYTVSVSEEQNCFEIVNESKEEGEQPEKLPQTGQLWWPVPILSAAGLLLFLAGWIRRRKSDES